MLPSRSPLALLLAAALAGCAAPATEDGGAEGGTPTPPGSARAFGESRVVAVAPAPWHVEGLALHGALAFSGTAFGAEGDPVPILTVGEPSRIFAWDRASGELAHTILVEGEDATRSHAIVGVKTDAEGRLYALSSQLGLLRFTLEGDSWTQERLAEIPDLPPCALGASPCSPTTDDEPPIGNDLTWGPDGALYVSDSFQATVWRLAPGGSFEVWSQDERFDRKFGPNGLRVSPDGSRMALAVTGPDGAEAGPVSRGSRVFAIPFPDPNAGDVEELLVLPNGDATDGLAYGADGDLYVLSNFGNRIFVLANGTGDVTTIENGDLAGGARMDFPASLAFDGAGALLVANYAYFDAQATGRSDVIEIFVDDAGFPEPAPSGFEPAS